MSTEDTDRITRIVLNGTAEDVSKLVSPVDGGRLVVSFFSGRRMAVSVRSRAGDYRLNLDGVEKAPPWVGTHGNTIETCGPET